jgi:hypothetical protein
LLESGLGGFELDLQPRAVELGEDLARLDRLSWFHVHHRDDPLLRDRQGDLGRGQEATLDDDVVGVGLGRCEVGRLDRVRGLRVRAGRSFCVGRLCDELPRDERDGRGQGDCEGE